jgi:hypothetical protein
MVALPYRGNHVSVLADNQRPKQLMHGALCELGTMIARITETDADNTVVAGDPNQYVLSRLDSTGSKAHGLVQRHPYYTA